MGLKQLFATLSGIFYDKETAWFLNRNKPAWLPAEISLNRQMIFSTKGNHLWRNRMLSTEPFTKRQSFAWFGQANESENGKTKSKTKVMFIALFDARVKIYIYKTIRWHPVFLECSKSALQLQNRRILAKGWSLGRTRKVFFCCMTTHLYTHTAGIVTQSLFFGPKTNSRFIKSCV